MHELIMLPLFIATSLSSPVPYAQSPHEGNNFLGYHALVSKNVNFQNANSQLQQAKSVPYYPDFQQFGREEAVLEQEHWLSKKYSIYDHAQSVAARILTPKPIVDTIQEHEKYGNDGGKYRQIAGAIINGYDAIGNIANTVVDAPYKAKGALSKTILAALNALGGKLVGV